MNFFSWMLYVILIFCFFSLSVAIVGLAIVIGSFIYRILFNIYKK